jgi:membrane-associated phospholipid phosphatase
MSRTILALAIVLPVTGCQAWHRHQGARPQHLDQRLATVESNRLSDSACSATDGQIDIGIRTNRPAGNPARVTIVQNDAWRDAVHTLTLGEFDDEGSDTSYEDSYSETRDDVSYARKPPLDSFWDTVNRDIRDMPSDLWRDTKRVYANPTNLVILGTAYGGSLALQETGPDDTVEDHFRHGHHDFDKDWREAFAAAGNPGTHFALAGVWYLLGQQTQNEKTYEVGKTMFSALIINGLTTMIGQAATWDRAPNGELGTFPSGHTSSSFCMASVLHEAYGHAVGIPLYGLATLVAYERVDDNEHYFSDVVMGAVMGTVIGHSVASGRDPEFFGWKVLPYANPNGGTGIAFMKSLD